MTARAVLTVVGQAAGAYVGAMVGMPYLGAAIGGQIGGAVGGAIDGPVRNSQALIEDLGAIKFDYGSTWPRIYGSYRLKVAPMWSSLKRPVAHDEEVDSKGGPSAVNTSFTYEMDWLCWAPLNAAGFSRIWVNGELKYSGLTDSTADTLLASAATTAWAAVTFFDGNAAQLPWPIYEAAVDTANASAYRYRPTLAFESLDLGRSGQPPLVEVEFYSSGVAAGGTSLFSVPFTDDTSDDVAPDPATKNSFNASYFSVIDGVGIFAGSAGVGPQFIYTGAKLVIDAVQKFTLELLLTETPTFTGEIGNVIRIFGMDGIGSGASMGFRVVSAGIVLATVFKDGTGATLVEEHAYTGEFRLRIVLQEGATNRVRFYADDRLLREEDDAPVNFTQVSLGSTAMAGTAEIGQFNTTSLTGFYGTGVATVTLGTVTLASIVSSENLLTWSAEDGALTASDIDVTPLVATVTGFATTGSPREATAQLMDVFYFGAVCSDKLYYKLRGASAVDTIAFDETGSGVGQAGDPFTGLERANDLEVASQVAITGPNILWDYEPGTESSDLLVGESFELRRYQTPVVFTPAERKGRADTMVMDARVASHTGMVSLDDRHIELEPFDVWIQFDDEGNSYRVRAERETYTDSGREFDVVLDDASILSSVGITVSTDSRTITIALPDDTEIVLLDIPIRRDADNDPGFYAVAKGSADGARLYGSLNDVTYTQKASFASEGVFGTATTTLGDWTGGRVFDETNSVTVNVGDGTLASSTRTLLLADQSVNAFALGVDGRWELGQFRTATLVSAGVYTLTGLLRGSSGTEWASTGHTSGETFVLQTGAGRRVDVQTSELGIPQYYKGVTVGRSLGSAAAETFTDNGIGLKPFAPVHVRVLRDAATNDATISWTRRTRLSTRFASSLGIVAPLGETTEAYEVDVYSDGTYTTVVQTLTATTPSVSFTAAAQTAAGLTPGATLYLQVYQIGSVGRGYAAEKAA